MQTSHGITFRDGQESAPFQVHPEVAEYGVAILRRDLKLMRKTGLTTFLRRLYVDLHEIETLRMAAKEVSRKHLPSVVAVMVFNVDPETNARIPLSAEQLEQELAAGEYPFIEQRTPHKGFGRQH